jgi:anti-sigma regulatory factor (Ser/Thr protein kinase)
MRSADLQIARLPAPLSGGLPGSDLGPFVGYLARAPFPRSGGGSAGSAGSAAFGPRIELELDSGPTAAAEARAAVGALYGRADPDVLEDVRLLLSEIVTNAVRHSGSPAGTKIGLAVSVAGGAVRAEVTDAGGGFAPAPRSAPWTEAGGWGLHLVDRIATRWGADGRAPARVWFEIDSIS